MWNSKRNTIYLVLDMLIKQQNQWAQEIEEYQNLLQVKSTTVTSKFQSRSLVGFLPS